jgi:hypothetical protein
MKRPWADNPFEPDLVDFSGEFAYGDIRGYNVYSVILDTDSWANATTANRTFVLDNSTFAVPDQDPATPVAYTVPNNNPGSHEWQSVIPEPGTMGLMAIGLFGVLAVRRKTIN